MFGVKAGVARGRSGFCSVWGIVAVVAPLAAMPEIVHIAMFGGVVKMCDGEYDSGSRDRVWPSLSGLAAFAIDNEFTLVFGS